MTGAPAVPTRPVSSPPPVFRAPRFVVLILALGVYLSTGFFTVPANEVAVVRRFGRAVWPPRSSGLHLDLPWPWVRIDRVNLNASRTLTLGEASDLAGEFLMPASNRPATFLTGDRNLLQLRVTVQYRVSEEHLEAWLYGSRNSEERLQCLVETIVTELVARSGVDFVHTQGIAELNSRLLARVRTDVDRQRLGCHVEQVSLDRAEPPARVKADFLDVSNARADSARTRNEARAYAEQRLAESQADARQLREESQRDREAAIATAQGAADRFVKLVNQVTDDARQRQQPYGVARRLTLQRLYVEVVRDILSRAKSSVLLEGQPADLILSPRQSGAAAIQKNGLPDQGPPEVAPGR